jgi:hypothetical protein
MLEALDRSWVTALSIATEGRPAPFEGSSIRKKAMVDCSCSAWEASSSAVDDTCSEALEFC